MAESINTSNTSDNPPSSNNKISGENDDPKALVENLYKQNVEIAEKNKTLSLLSKLYEISILTLAPKELAKKISQTVQADLSFELVGILLYSKKRNELTPLAFASSERLKKIQSDFKISFENVTLPVSRSVFLKQIIKTKTGDSTEKLEDVWDDLVAHEMLTELSGKGHVRSSLAYPLIIQDTVIGILILSLNRLERDLVDFEKESIKSFVNVIAVALDKAIVSEKLKIANEQLKILDAARAEFITMASHQLRTPPSSIKWSLSAILANEFGQLDGELREALRKIDAANSSQISLIDALLNASRIERGKLEFVFEEADIAEITALTVDMLEPLARQKKLKLTFVKPSTALPKIVMDREKLRQVINNMIDNAIKYSKQGEIQVSLEQTPADLVLKVKDSGKGMGKNELKAAFEKYGRGKDSKKYAAGLGLGMYLARVIVEQHNGKIWAESPGEEQGSLFAFSLPIHNKLKPTSLVFDLTKTQTVK